MAVNQKAIKVLNRIFEAGFTEEKAIAGRHPLHAGHYRNRHRAYQ